MRSLTFPDMDQVWPSDDGWPYTDADQEPGELDLADPDADVDDDLVALHATLAHLYDGLAPLERAVVMGRFGLDGRPAQSMRELQHALGVPRAELRAALGDGLTKVRSNLG
jgi:DNA-directed RNA polymerase sigma subunit (sigma70/sigma32)